MKDDLDIQDARRYQVPIHMQQQALNGDVKIYETPDIESMFTG